MSSTHWSLACFSLSSVRRLGSSSASSAAKSHAPSDRLTGTKASRRMPVPHRKTHGTCIRGLGWDGEVSHHSPSSPSSATFAITIVTIFRFTRLMSSSPHDIARTRSKKSIWHQLCIIIIIIFFGRLYQQHQDHRCSPCSSFRVFCHRIATTTIIMIVTCMRLLSLGRSILPPSPLPPSAPNALSHPFTRPHRF